MDHYKQAENLINAGLPDVATAHAILALVDVLRRSDDENATYDVPEFLRPVKTPSVKRNLL